MAPSTRAASSMSASTPAIPVRAERMKNGRRDERLGEDHGDRREGNVDTQRRERLTEQAAAVRRRAAARDQRPRVEARSGGPRCASSRPEPRNRRRASTIASGKPKATVRMRLAVVVTRLRASASRTAGDVKATAQRAVDDRARNQHGDGQRRGRARRPPRWPPAASPGDRGTAVGASPNREALERAGCRHRVPRSVGGAGTRSWPGSPARQVRRTRSGTPARRPDSAMALTTTPAYVAGTLAVGGIVTGADLGRCLGVGHVDDRRVAFAELDLGHDGRTLSSFEAMLALYCRDEVGRDSRVPWPGSRRAWLAYFVIGTASPAAMILTPRLGQVRRAS